MSSAEHLLSLWLGMSERERRLFDDMRKTLEESADFMRDSVHRQTDLFQDLAMRSRTQTQQMREVVEFAREVDLDGQAIPMTEVTAFVAKVMQDIISIVINLSRHAVSITYSLDDVVGQVDAARKCVAMIDEINRTTNMIAINAKIEAHRAGEAGRAFDVVATEIRSLSVRVNGISKEIGQRIGQVQSSVQQSHSTLRDIAAIDMTEHLLAKERLDQMLAALGTQTTQFQTLMNTALSAQAEMDQTIDQIIQSTQYEDVVRQRIDSVRLLMGQASHLHQILTGLSGNFPAAALSDLTTAICEPALTAFLSEQRATTHPNLSVDSGSIELF